MIRISFETQLTLYFVCSHRPDEERTLTIRPILSEKFLKHFDFHWMFIEMVVSSQNSTWQNLPTIYCHRTSANPIRIRLDWCWCKDRGNMKSIGGASIYFMRLLQKKQPTNIFLLHVRFLTIWYTIYVGRMFLWHRTSNEYGAHRDDGVRRKKGRWLNFSGSVADWCRIRYFPSEPFPLVR